MAIQSVQSKLHRKAKIKYLCVTNLCSSECKEVVIASFRTPVVEAKKYLIIIKTDKISTYSRLERLADLVLFGECLLQQLYSQLQKNIIARACRKSLQLISNFHTI
jgi:hypothetical protein